MNSPVRIAIARRLLGGLAGLSVPEFPHSGMRAGILGRLTRWPGGAAVVVLLLQGMVAEPSRAAEPIDPAALYETHCAACHGRDGRGVLPGSPDFRRPDTLAKPNGVLMRAIRDGKGAMPAYYGVLSDAETRRVVDYLRRFN